MKSKPAATGGSTAVGGEPERILRDVPCGWCMTGYHAGCKLEITYYGKIWVCNCGEAGHKL